MAYIAFAEGGAKGIAKLLSAEKLAEIKQTLGAKDGDAVLYMVGSSLKLDKFAGKTRL